MARILNSPNQNVAGEQVVLLQTAITEIKKLIISGASQKQIQTVINNYCSKFTNEQTQAVFRRNLIQSTNKMLYEHNHNMKIINQSFINQVIKAFAIGTGTTLSNNTYTIDLTAIYREYLNDEIDQRKVITEFRNHITNAKKGLALIKDYDRKVIEQTKLLASEPVKYIAKDGRAISLRNKVEMSVRYEANMKDLDQYKSLGIKLVWTSSHADASPRCSPFQGKLWSLDGTSGTIDGIKYQPIEIALNANGGNSIINGYNCRHYLIEYEKGSVAPRHFTSKEIQKEYRIDQRQRLYENEIRHKKTMETLLRQQGFKEEASKMREQWQNLNKRYEEYSIKNGRAFYRWRTKISQEERQKIIEVRNLNVLQKQVDSISKGFGKEKVEEFQNDYNQFKKDSWRFSIEKQLLKEKEIYSRYQKGIANENNFYINTMANFTEIEKPDRKPDYISYNRRFEISSMYWYTKDGVIRGSDHWGKGVASCDWFLNNNVGKLVVGEKRQYGFCKWDEFIEKTQVLELEVDGKKTEFLMTLENVIGKDKDTGNTLVKNGDYIVSVDRDGICDTESPFDYVPEKQSIISPEERAELRRKQLEQEKEVQEEMQKIALQKEKERIAEEERRKKLVQFRENEEFYISKLNEMIGDNFKDFLEKNKIDYNIRLSKKGNEIIVITELNNMQGTLKEFENNINLKREIARYLFLNGKL
ncbi:MAG: minor capsid protein 2 [Podoviridae sp. ctcf755]|nr:MAG: minor capsid protein 2 [Podoviridae sp. ctcf755]